MEPCAGADVEIRVTREDTLMRRHALVLLFVVASTAAAVPQDYGLLQSKTDSDERWAPINALKARAPELAKAFAPHVYVNRNGERMPYRLFTPARLEPGRTYPLVVFLHGASGSGTDNAKQLEGGNLYGSLVWVLRENQAKHPAFVLAPQSDWNWPCTIFDPKNPPKIAADIRLCPPDVLGIGARLAFEVIDSLLGTLPIDRSRIYVTGHSMGGAGTWHMIAHRPRFFAAAVPVCGRGHPQTASVFKDVPVWNFHGVKDDVEPVASSRAMIEALRIWPLLKGTRGEPGIDMDALVEIIERLSYFASKNPDVAELDINPLMVSAKGCRAVDARIIWG